MRSIENTHLFFSPRNTALFWFTDRPVCRRSGAHLWYSDPWETVELPCAVDAYPTDGVVFSWVLRKGLDQGEEGEGVLDKAIERLLLDACGLPNCPHVLL